MDREEIDFDMAGFEKMMAAMALNSGNESIGSVLDACPDIRRRLKGACPVTTAAVFGGLLLDPRFHKNTLRLEYLIHVSMAIGNGCRVASPKDVMFSYKTIGDRYGSFEDPPEELFSHRVCTRRGNFTVLSGIWEGAAFYLQRFMNVVDSMPDVEPYRSLSNSIYALLKISDFVCARSIVEVHGLSGERGKNNLSKFTSVTSSRLGKSVSLTSADMELLGVRVEDIEEYVFDPCRASELKGQEIGQTCLEQKPLAILGGKVYLVLPTAVSLAIRWKCIAAFGGGDWKFQLGSALSMEYSRLFSQDRVLGI